MKLLNRVRPNEIGKFALAGTAFAVSIASLGLPGLSVVNAYVAPTPTAIVTLIEGSYVPDAVYFAVDQPVANCISGAYLIYQGGGSFPRGTADDSMRRANVRHMAQTLLLQKSIGAKVTVYAGNVASGNQYCVVENIHVPTTN